MQTDDGETVDETEPATNHDVAEGGIIGAVGGAVVGMLAGGPIGAVIGAIIGGAASAGAVGAVDKHDYENTANDDVASEDGTRSENDMAVAPSIPAAPGMTPMGMIEPVQTMPPVYAGEPMPSADTVEPLPPMLGADRTDPMSPMPTSPAWDLTSETRERAYALYDRRGRGDGHDVDDWLAAEREVFKG